MADQQFSAIRTRNLFDPAQTSPYKLSRSKIESFLRCPRCFYLDRRLGIAVPDTMRLSLNLAVDVLLKREFDVYRAKAEPHPLMIQNSIEAIPFAHPQLEEWRDAMRGIQALHRGTNFLVFGAIDDAWVAPDGSLHIVDYKATSSPGDVTSLSAGRDGYRRQAEVYQWLFRANGYHVSDTAYFVFANADAGHGSFEGSLHFRMTVVPHEGADDWIEDALKEAKICLQRETPPQPHPACEWCGYRTTARRFE